MLKDSSVINSFVQKCFLSRFWYFAVALLRMLKCNVIWEEMMFVSIFLREYTSRLTLINGSFSIFPYHSLIFDLVYSSTLNSYMHIIRSSSTYIETVFVSLLSNIQSKLQYVEMNNEERHFPAINVPKYRHLIRDTFVACGWNTKI